jgi:acetyltransferase-like isoleucine patch superfamily enzyme
MTDLKQTSPKQDCGIDLQTQHKLRLSWMPWLYFSLKPKHQQWAKPWQDQIQRNLSQCETVTIGEDCFVAPEAKIFAEPGRTIVLGSGCAVAAEAFLHGPIIVGDRVSFNARVVLDGGVKGISIGDDTRIASGAAFYAFDHNIEPHRTIREQTVRSQGITIGKDVWVGAQACITDGVVIGDHAVVAMGAVVTRHVEPWQIVAGNPARPIGDRRTKERWSPSAPDRSKN